MKFSPSLTLPSLALAALSAPSLSAQTITYNVCLDGAQEVPAVATAGTGSATVVLDTSTNVVTVSGSYANLGGNQTGAHVHGPAPIGGNGGIVVSLTGTGGTNGTFSGAATLTAGQAADLQNGLHYINVHSVAHPAGEVRGQIVQRVDASCPAELATDPVLSDNAGNPGWGPKIGSAAEPFDLALDCSGASANSVYVMELRPGKAAAPPVSKWGLLYLTGPKLMGTSGMHNQGTVSWFPGGATLPNDPTLPGLSYHAQGFCGGFVPNGRTSNALTQTIGI